MIVLARIAFLALLLFVWEYGSIALHAEFFVSRPTQIAAASLRLLNSGAFFYHFGITATESSLGFLIGSAIGIAVGLLLGRVKPLADVLEPFLTALYSLPKVALAPLFILWFGIGIDMKIILAAATVFFLVFLNTYTGVRNVSAEQLAILRLMGAKERHLITKVIVPSAFTWVFAGLRLSVPYALIGAVVGEMIAANRGLGYLLSDAAAQFDTASVFACLIGIILLAMAFNGAVKLAEYFLMPWKVDQEQREITV
jgi:NitT/TauT family transport system permease protein